MFFYFLCLLFSLTTTWTVEASNKTRSTKKGVCIAPEFFRCGDLDAFPGVSWYYNWGEQPSGGGDCPSSAMEFVPMIWGFWGQQMPSLSESTVLGFNEPNHVDQSNLDPETAAYNWVELQQAYPDKVLVGPSASPPNELDWFERFFEVCAAIGCRMDYVATHAYSGNADWDMQSINTIYQRWGKKVWFTEFARPTTRDPAMELEYMQAILPQLEAAESVYRYSWFVNRWPYSAKSNTSDWYLDKAISLQEADSNSLTELGRYYDQF